MNKREFIDFISPAKDVVRYSIFWALAFAFMGYFIAEYMFPQFVEFILGDIKNGDSILTNLKVKYEIGHGSLGIFKGAVTIVFTLLGFFMAESYKLKRHINDSTKHINSLIERLSTFAEHSAFYLDDFKTKENTINLLRSKENGVMWITAKFISKQLSKSFNRLEIKVDGDEYSKFCRDLYPECNDSIYLTSPFTPAEWFRQLYAKRSDILIKMINNNENLKDFPEEIPPPHINALLNAKAKEKKRLILFPKANWKSLIAQEKLLEKFIEFNADKSNNIIIDCRFVEVEELCDDQRYSFGATPSYDFLLYDYAIFDKEVVLKWKRPEKENLKESLLLEDISRIHAEEDKLNYERILELFEFRKGQHLTWQEVKDKINEKKNEIKNYVVANKSLPHKYAYFTEGATAWVRIASDQEYLLGRSEIKALQKVVNILSDYIEGNYNIIHIGVGDGKEIPYLLSGIGESAVKLYSLVDISPELLMIAENSAIKNFPNVKFAPKVLDVIEEDLPKHAKNLKTNYASKNIIILIANGAILSNESVFPNVKESMDEDDLLLVTLETYSENKKNELLDHFRIKTVQSLLQEPLKIIGIDKSDSSKYYDVNYNAGNQHIEILFNYSKWKENNPSFNNGGSSFPDSINIFSSYRPTYNEMITKFERAGFEKIDSIEPNDENLCCGVLFKLKV